MLILIESYNLHRTEREKKKKEKVLVIKSKIIKRGVKKTKGERMEKVLM